jgi:hypothetical protein
VVDDLETGSERDLLLLPAATRSLCCWMASDAFLRAAAMAPLVTSAGSRGFLSLTALFSRCCNCCILVL